MSDRASDWPKVFLSYRWESSEHKEWVSRFARALGDRMIRVVYDQVIKNQRPSQLQADVVPMYLLAEIPSCHIFIPILTRGYIERIRDFFPPRPPAFGVGVAVRTEMRIGNFRQRVRNGGFEDGWVFDEFQEYISQNKIRREKLGGSMPLAPVLRDGCIDHLPAGFPTNSITDLRGVELRSISEHEGLLDEFGSLVWDFAHRFPIPVTENPLDFYVS